MKLRQTVGEFLSGPLKLENATVLSCRNLTFTAMIVNDFFQTIFSFLRNKAYVIHIKSGRTGSVEK